MNENEKKRKADFAAIIIVQLACVLIFLLGFISIKYFAPKTHKQVKKIIETHFSEDTDIDEFLKFFSDEN